MILPSLDGVMPSPECASAFSISLMSCGSHGWIVISRASGVEMIGNLFQRGHRAIIVDTNTVQQGHRGPTRPEAGQIPLQVFQRDFHLFRDSFGVWRLGLT